MTFRYASLILVGVTVVVFVLQLSVEGLTNAFLLTPDAFTAPWLFVTHIFLHGSFEHLFYNMFALALFGFILENIVGTRRFLYVFFGTGIVSALGSVFFYSASLGASGAIFGVLGCLAFLRPRMTVWVMWIPMPMIVAAGLWILIDLVGVFYPTNVANIAHLVGMGAGMVAGWLLKEHKEPPKLRYITNMDEDDVQEWEEQWF
jgi:hypothetical protein